MLKQLQACLAPDGSLCTKAAWEEATLAESMVHRERQRYLEGSAIYEELVALLEEPREESGGGNGRPGLPADLDAVAGRLQAAESVQRLPLPNVDAGLVGGDGEDDREGEELALGVDAEALWSAAAGARGPGSLGMVVPELERRLAERCRWLFGLVGQGSSDTSEGGGAVAARSRRAGRILQGRLEAHEAARAEYHQTVGEIVSLLARVVGEHRLQHQAGSDLVHASWLCARCRAMYSKLRVLEQRVMRDTYTADVVPALEAISRHIEDDLRSMSSERASARSRLQLYAGMDAEYDRLVQEHARLSELVKQREWTLQEVDQGM